MFNVRLPSSRRRESIAKPSTSRLLAKVSIKRRLKGSNRSRQAAARSCITMNGVKCRPRFSSRSGQVPLRDYRGASWTVSWIRASCMGAVRELPNEREMHLKFKFKIRKESSQQIKLRSISSPRRQTSSPTRTARLVTITTQPGPSASQQRPVTTPKTMAGN